MKAKKTPKRISRTTLLGALLCFCLGHHAAGLAATDSASSIAIADSDEFKSLIASDLMLVGPVEVIDRRSATVRVLGQTVRGSGLAKRTFARLAVGNVVIVRGRVVAAGQIEANALSIASRQYVAGAQAIFLRGIIDAIHSDVGTLAVGRLIVDYTASLHSLDVGSLRVGAEIVVAGIQPVASGSVLALSASSRPSGITGSDIQARGIAGSDVQARGITGSDIQARGIAGSDVQGRGITGSDVAGIAGSDF
jgi:hypothetical protein